MNFTQVSKKISQRLFRKVSGISWDITTGIIGLKKADGTFLTFTAGTPAREAIPAAPEAQPPFLGAPAVEAVPAGLNEAYFSFTRPIPAFAIATPLDQIEAGDVIVGQDRILGFAVSATSASVKYLGPEGQSSTYAPPTTNVLGTAQARSVLVVKNLFTLFGGQDGANNVLGGLLPLLATGNDVDSEQLMTLAFLSRSNQAAADGTAPAVPAGGIDPMMMMMLMRDKDEDGEGGLGDLAPLMLLGGQQSQPALQQIMLMKALGKKGGGKIDPMMMLAMSGGLGGAQAGGFGGGAGGINPMMLAMLGGGEGLFGADEETSSTLPAPAVRGSTSEAVTLSAPSTLPAPRRGGY